jgi:hypothetical protein
MRSSFVAMPVLVFPGAHPSAVWSQECEDTAEGSHLPDSAAAAACIIRLKKTCAPPRELQFEFA